MHYICTGGCKGVAKEPGVCQAAGCPRYHQPLEPCDCPDDRHFGAFSQEKQSDEKRLE